MTVVKGIIVLEGADCAGKTTLAHALMEHIGPGSEYFHMGLTEDPFGLCLSTFKEAIEASQEGVAILDRSWISEPAYGLTYRQETRIPVAAACFDRLLLKHAAVTVLCVPSDIQKQCELHAKMREERTEDYASIKEVATWYQDLLRGSIVRGGEDYGSQCQRYGDFGLRPDVLHYDMQAHKPNKLQGVIGSILRRLDELRTLQLPAALESANTNFQGNVGLADVIFVGDDLSPQGNDYPWPWFWPDGKNGSAAYFNKLLRELGFNETRGVYVNANQDPNMLPALAYFYQKHFSKKAIRWVLLGKEASNAIDRLNISHVPQFSFHNLRHPQHVKRFTPNSPAYKEELRHAITRTTPSSLKRPDQHGVAEDTIIRF